jgi:hypothetical protein
MLLWIEGFEGFGVSGAPSPANVMARKYATVVSESDIAIQAGRWSGYSIKFTSQYNAITLPNLTTNATLVVGFAFKPYPIAYYDHEFLTFYDGATRGINLRLIQATRRLAVYRGDTLLGTSVDALTVSLWYYIELKVVCNDTTGSYEVRVNGVNVLSATGVDTKEGTNNYHTTFKISGKYGENPSFDDLYCLDGSGAINNDFLGIRQVLATYPNAAGDVANWTPSAGDNYACVDENPTTDDTDYVQTSASGNLDLYNFTDLVGTDIVGTLNGIQINMMVRNTGGGSLSVHQPSKLAGVQSDGTAAAVADATYAVKTRIMETDPSAAAWTVTNLNSAQFGVKVQ